MSSVDERFEDKPLAVVGGFKVLPLRQKHLPVGVVHYLYFRLEQGGEFPSERTIFAVNPSFFFAEEDFRLIFEMAGPVERVVLGQLGPASSFAESGCGHIVFKRAKDAKRALNWTPAESRVVAAQTSSSGGGRGGGSKAKQQQESTGIAQWVNEYKRARVAPAVIRKKADAFISNFEVEAAKAEEASRNSAPDDDGWITVKPSRKRDRPAATPKKAKPGYEPPVITSNKSVFESKVLEDFYVFQRREKRRRELASLRESFSVDKARIAKMKGDRKFRP